MTGGGLEPGGHGGVAFVRGEICARKSGYTFSFRTLRGWRAWGQVCWLPPPIEFEMRAFLIFAAMVLCVSPALAVDAREECVLSAARQNSLGKQSIIDADTGAVWSVDTWIALRRVQETYCKEYARCMTGGQEAGENRVPYEAEFSKCLLHGEAAHQ